MSKKSHKKSPKSGRAAAVAAKSGQAGGAKTRKTAAKRPAKAAASHAAKSKPLSPRGAPAPAAKAAKPVGSRKVPSGGLAEGARAPAFTLPRDGGGSISLSDFKGRKLVLFFYPKANTPGCTREAIDFTRLADDFAKAGAVAVGVSADSVKAQDSFRDKHTLGVPLASDETHGMLEAYGAWGEKSLYGRKFMGIIRSTVLIDGSGTIVRIWRNVKVDGHADEVLTAVRAV